MVFSPWSYKKRTVNIFWIYCQLSPFLSKTLAFPFADPFFKVTSINSKRTVRRPCSTLVFEKEKEISLNIVLTSCSCERKWRAVTIYNLSCSLSMPVRRKWITKLFPLWQSTVPLCWSESVTQWYRGVATKWQSYSSMLLLSGNVDLTSLVSVGVCLF